MRSAQGAGWALVRLVKALTEGEAWMSCDGNADCGAQTWKFEAQDEVSLPHWQSPGQVCLSCVCVYEGEGVREWCCISSHSAFSSRFSNFCNQNRLLCLSLIVRSYWIRIKKFFPFIRQMKCTLSGLLSAVFVLCVPGAHVFLSPLELVLQYVQVWTGDYFYTVCFSSCSLFYLPVLIRLDDS